MLVHFYLLFQDHFQKRPDQIDETQDESHYGHLLGDLPFLIRWTTVNAYEILFIFPSITKSPIIDQYSEDPPDTRNSTDDIDFNS